MENKNKSRSTQEAQERIRYSVVEYLNNNCGTQKEAGDIFGISESAVNKIWAKYKSLGKRGLASKKSGVQGGKKITGIQAAEIRRLIKDKLPDQLKLPFGLWTRDAVEQLIFSAYGITLSRWQAGRYLKSWGYTPQKPIKGI
jgi:transposase